MDASLQLGFALLTLDIPSCWTLSTSQLVDAEADYYFMTYFYAPISTIVSEVL